ncbi:DM13 domain-containing protein [Ekhidna sp.]
MRKILLLTIVLTSCIETDLQAPIAESLRIVPSGESFRVGASYELVSEFLNSDGMIEEVDVLWTTSDPSVFSITGSTGSGISEGTAIITVSARGLEASEEIVIESSKGSLTITMYVSQLQVGNDFLMGANYIDSDGNSGNTAVTWTSSDETIASINSSGLVNALSAGTTNIQASASGFSDAVTLTVVDGTVMVDPEVRITHFIEEVNVGENFQFQASYFDSNAMVDEDQTISWTSSNTSVLTIDNTGLATGIAQGEVTIEASANGVATDLTVSVVGEATTTRTGSLQGTGYSISGDFSMTYNEDDDLILTVSNFNTDGPGPYFYLTNQTTSIANGLNLGSAESNGSYTINVSEIARDESVEVDLFTYSVLMIWCEPFGVRLGFGEFDN